MKRRRHVEQPDADDRFLVNRTIPWYGQERLLSVGPRGSIAVRRTAENRRYGAIARGVYERVLLPQMRHSGTTPANHEVVWITDICVGFLHGLRCF